MRALLALLLLTAAPLAAADHVYSHRILIEGRVIGENGYPVVGAVAQMEMINDRVTEPCVEGHKQITDEWGDFWFCYHRHELSPDAVIRVTVGNATETRPFDHDLRRMVFYLRDENATGEKPATWDSTYFLDGRVWESGPARLEGVNVNGIALARAPVNVTLVNTADEENRTGTYNRVPTNGYGDYSVILRLGSGRGPDNVLVRVTANNGTVEERLDPVFHRTTLDLRFPLEGATDATMPGERSGPISAGLILAAALALSVAIAVQRRKNRRPPTGE